MIATIAGLVVAGWLSSAGVVWGCYQLIGAPVSAPRAAAGWPFYAGLLAIVAIQVFQEMSFNREVGL